MTRSAKVWCGVLVGGLGVAGVAAIAQPQAADFTADESAIHAVLDLYLKGVDKQDTAMLEKAFVGADAHMKYVVKGPDGKETLKVVPIREAFANWTKPPAKSCKGRTLNLDIVDGKAAVAKYEFIWGDVTFIDFLTLYKIEGEWKIVNKVFVRR